MVPGSPGVCWMSSSKDYLAGAQEQTRSVRCVESIFRARVLAAQHSASAAALTPWETPDPICHRLLTAGA